MVIELLSIVGENKEDILIESTLSIGFVTGLFSV